MVSPGEPTGGFHKGLMGARLGTYTDHMEILLLIDLHGAANSFLQSIRSLPVLSNTRAVDAREKRLETDYTKAMACLQEHSLDHQAAYVNAVHFHQALPEAVGARVLELAY